MDRSGSAPQLLLQLLVVLPPLLRKTPFLVRFRAFFLLNIEMLTLHLAASQAVNQPVKVGGSKPCLVRTMGVSGSLAPGWVRRYSRHVIRDSLRSTSLASCPIQMKTWMQQEDLED